MGRDMSNDMTLVCVACLGVGVTVVSAQDSAQNNQELNYETNFLNIWALGRLYEPWLCSILASIIIGLSGIFPLLVIPIEAGPSLKQGAAARTLRYLLSFAVGGLLGDVFLHLLPEAWNQMHQGSDPQGGHRCQMSIGLWVLAGIFTFTILEVVFAQEEENEKTMEKRMIKMKTKPLQDEQDHETTLPNGNANHIMNSSQKSRSRHNRSSQHQNGHANGHAVEHYANGDAVQSHSYPPEQNPKQIAGYLNLMANSIDNFTHGLAVAGSFLVSFKVGVLTTFAILIHEIPHEIGDFAILIKSGFNRWEAAKAQLFTAGVGLLGALAALTAESSDSIGDWTSWILPFTAGGFINIALVNVLPDLLKVKDLRESFKLLLCLVAGIAIMAGVTLLFE